MAHKSFEGESVAGHLSEHYSKARPGERPDADAMHLEAVQANGGQARRTMATFLTPAKESFSSRRTSRPSHGTEYQASDRW